MQEIGRGGIGTVYKAYDTQLKRIVAVKTLRADALAPQARAADLAREAQTLARLSHPNIVTVFDGGEIDGVPFLCMEYVEGAHLGELVRGRKPPLQALVRILMKAAEGVAFAHSRGIVHRDLKPGNVIVDSSHEPKVIDFGLARLLDHQTFLALSGSPIGTPYYMSPEQVRDAKSVGPESDVYSLGVCLYEIMTGRIPFEGSDAWPVFERILRGEPAPPRSLRSDLPADLETICLKAMDRDPRRRYRNAAEFADDLSRHLNGMPISAHPPTAAEKARRWISRRATAIAVAGGAVLLAGLATWAIHSQQARETAREKLEQYRRRREQFRPLEAMIQETRPFFYIKDADVPARLSRVTAFLDGLEREAGVGDSVDLWTALGRGWYFAGDLTRAQHALEKGLSFAPEDGQIHHVLGRIFLDRAMIELSTRDGRTDRERQARAKELNARALEHFRKGISWDGTGEIDRALAAAYRALAEGTTADVARLCRVGLDRFAGELGAEEFSCLLGTITEGEERIAHLSRAIERRPHYAWALLQRGSAWLVHGNLARALEDLDRAVALNPHGPYVYNDRGLVHYSRGEWDAAVSDFNQALRIDPENVFSYLNRAIARAAKGDLEGAIADCDRAVAANPLQPIAYQNRGIFRRTKGDLAGALADADRAVVLAPERVSACLNRGLTRAALEDWPAAIADYDRVLRIDPRNADAYAARGVARLSMNEIPQAKADLEKALEINPRQARALYYRGTFRVEAREFEAALEDFNESIRGDPSFAPVYASRGILWEELGKLDRAIEDYDAALRINPRYPDALLSRGIAWQEKGDLNRAIADLTKALECSPKTWNSRPLAERSLAEARRNRQE